MNRLHLAVVLVLLGSGTLSAQRTMPGQDALSLRGSVFRTSAGLDLSLSQGLPFGYSSLSVGIDDRRSALSNGESLRYDDITLTPSVMARLTSTRSRSLCLYAGAGAIIGCEVCDPMSSLDPNVETGASLQDCMTILAPIAATDKLMEFTGRLRINTMPMEGCQTRRI